MESKTRSALNGAGWKLRSLHARARQNRQRMTEPVPFMWEDVHAAMLSCMHPCTAARQGGAMPRILVGSHPCFGWVRY
jgi:hypothetical protein